MDKKWYEVAKLPDGSTLGRCLICPKFTADSRDTDNPANHTSIAIQDPAGIAVWARGHAATEMHAWYKSAKKVPVERTRDEQLLDQIFGSVARPPKRPPFKYAVSTRRAGARPKW